MALTLISGDFILFDFNTNGTSGKWYTVNDDVMGGISKSKFEVNEDGWATFSGVLSPDNNGGFASVRATLEKNAKSKFDGVILRVRGDGKTYKARFRTDRNFDGYAYEASFQTEKNTWKEFKIPFSEFNATFRGRILSDKPELESKNIEQIGLLIADKQFGEFTVDIDWIKFY